MPDNCVTEYFEELLAPPPTSSGDDAPDIPPRETPCYRLVHLCGLKLLLPPEFNDLMRDRPSNSDNFTCLDARPALFPAEHPALRQEARPGCWLELPTPKVQMWFERDAGPIPIDTYSIAWRENTTTRPWLKGTVAALKAAIVDPEALATSARQATAGEANG